MSTTSNNNHNHNHNNNNNNNNNTKWIALLGLGVVAIGGGVVATKIWKKRAKRLAHARAAGLGEQNAQQALVGLDYKAVVGFSSRALEHLTEYTKLGGVDDKHTNTTTIRQNCLISRANAFLQLGFPVAALRDLEDCSQQTPDVSLLRAEANMILGKQSPNKNEIETFAANAEKFAMEAVENQQQSTLNTFSQRKTNVLEWVSTTRKNNFAPERKTQVQLMENFEEFCRTKKLNISTPCKMVQKLLETADLPPTVTKHLDSEIFVVLKPNISDFDTISETVKQQNGKSIQFVIFAEENSVVFVEGEPFLVDKRKLLKSTENLSNFVSQHGVLFVDDCSKTIHLVPEHSSIFSVSEVIDKMNCSLLLVKKVDFFPAWGGCSFAFEAHHIEQMAKLMSSIGTSGTEMTALISFHAVPRAAHFALVIKHLCDCKALPTRTEAPESSLPFLPAPIRLEIIAASNSNVRDAQTILHAAFGVSSDIFDFLQEIFALAKTAQTHTIHSCKPKQNATTTNDNTVNETTSETNSNELDDEGENIVQENWRTVLHGCCKTYTVLLCACVCVCEALEAGTKPQDALVNFVQWCEGKRALLEACDLACDLAAWC